MILLTLAGVVLAGLALLALPLCCAVAFSWSVGFRREVWTQRDFAVACLLATGGVLSPMPVALGEALAGNLQTTWPTGAAAGAIIRGVVAAAWIAPVTILGCGSLGWRKHADTLMCAGAGLVGLASLSIAWTFSAIPALALWYTMVLVLLVADAGQARRAFETRGGCPGCGYPMAGLMTATCPECGMRAHCGACGFDVGDSPPGMPCPECGSAPSRA